MKLTGVALSLLFSLNQLSLSVATSREITAAAKNFTNRSPSGCRMAFNRKPSRWRLKSHGSDTDTLGCQPSG